MGVFGLNRGQQEEIGLIFQISDFLFSLFPDGQDSPQAGFKGMEILIDQRFTGDPQFGKAGFNSVEAGGDSIDVNRFDFLDGMADGQPAKE